MAATSAPQRHPASGTAAIRQMPYLPPVGMDVHRRHAMPALHHPAAALDV